MFIYGMKYLIISSFIIDIVLLIELRKKKFN